jgi:hypothetical protein
MTDHLKTKPANDYLRIQTFMQVEGKWVASVDCDDYDHYKSLPHAMEVNGILVGKTGWSSDREAAYYQQGALLGKVVR